MFLTYARLYRNHTTKLIGVIIITTILGCYPVLSSKAIANLIDQPSEHSFYIYTALITSQAFLTRLDQYLLQNIQAKIQPEIRYYLKTNFPNPSLKTQDCINKIVMCYSNPWPIFFIMKSFILIISTSWIMLQQNSTCQFNWIIFFSATATIAICWQPSTQSTIQRQYKLSNKFIASTATNLTRLKSACIKANLLTNNIIFKQQAKKSLILSLMLILIAYSDWQLFLKNKNSIGNTIMLIQLNLSISEIIWWLQNELITTKNNLINALEANSQLMS